MILILNSSIEKIDIQDGMKFGCMQIMDDGTEYLHMIKERISDIEEEKTEFFHATEEGKYARSDWNGWGNGRTIVTPAYIYTPINFEVHGRSVTFSDFDKAIEELQQCKEIKHYKCRCKKCGKIRYYSKETLQTEPKFCYRPIYCSTRFTYSIKANNANYDKRKKYENNEAVRLVGDKEAVIPAYEYCGAWNDKRKKELFKQAEKDAQIIAAIPRKNALNYDIDFTGLIYESLEVLECVNDKLESVPNPYFTQRHQKKYEDVIVYKEYRCRCYLCGKEIMVTCDKFGIFPPTEYGYRAYNGYWSAVFCECHTISSFQWIVNDILIKNAIDYRVEVEVEGVYGIDNKTPLKYDFAVYEKGEIVAFIECQGEQHYKPVIEFGGERRFAIQQRNDEVKRKYAEGHRIPMIEISYKSKKYETIESILRDNHII